MGRGDICITRHILCSSSQRAVSYSYSRRKDGGTLSGRLVLSVIPALKSLGSIKHGDRGEQNCAREYDLQRNNMAVSPLCWMDDNTESVR